MGGPIAFVEEGDIISINIPEYKLELKVDDAELQKRKENWKPVKRELTGYLARYEKLVTTADKGAVLSIND